VLCLGVALLTLSGLLVAAAPALWGLYLAAFVAGLGNCVFHPADFALLNHRVSQPRLGHAFSVHGLSGNLGWALGPVLMATTAGALGWRTAGLTAALVGGTSLSTLWWKRTEMSDMNAGEPSHHQARRKAGSGAGIRSLLQLRLTWFAFSFFFFSTLAFGAFQAFAAPLLNSLYGLSLAAGNSALTAYLVGGAAGLAAGGFLANAAKGQERLVGFAFLCSAALAFLLAFSIVPAWAVFGIMALMGFGVGIAGPSRDMLVRKSTAARLGTGAFGRIYGLVYSGLDVGLAVAPLVFGMLMDAGRTQLVFVGVAISLVFAIIAAQAIAAEATAAAERR
jgi:predicted MFS family arabinose efflux permease